MTDTTQNTLWPDPITPPPSGDELERMATDSIVPATDGCAVEPDGVCEHGHPSRLIHLGVI